MRILRDGHDKVLDQVDRQRAESEQKAAEDAHAFERATRRGTACRRAGSGAKARRATRCRERADNGRATGRRDEARRRSDVGKTSASRSLNRSRPAHRSRSCRRRRRRCRSRAGRSRPSLPRSAASPTISRTRRCRPSSESRTGSAAAGDKLLGRDKPAPVGAHEAGCRHPSGDVTPTRDWRRAPGNCHYDNRMSARQYIPPAQISAVMGLRGAAGMRKCRLPRKCHAENR